MRDKKSRETVTCPSGSVSEKANKAPKGSQQNGRLEPMDTRPAPRIEVATKPDNPSGSYLFLGLENLHFIAGKNVDGVLVLVVNRPMTVSKIGLNW